MCSRLSAWNVVKLMMVKKEAFSTTEGPLFLSKGTLCDELLHLPDNPVRTSNIVSLWTFRTKNHVSESAPEYNSFTYTEFRYFHNAHNRSLFLYIIVKR